MLPDICYPMEISEKYAPEIWGKICRLPFMVAIGMEGAGRSGLAGSVRERNATLHSILEARTTFPGNPLVYAIVPDQEDEKAMSAVLQKHDAALEFLAGSGIKSSAILWERILDCIEEVFPVIAKREAGHTITDYKTWLVQIAERVAGAAKEGDFLGIGGTRISEQEKAHIKRLEAALIEFDSKS